MLNFKKFNVDDVVTDMFGNVSETNVLFIYQDGLVRSGFLYRNYSYNGKENYYFRSNEINYDVEDCLYCEINIEV